MFLTATASIGTREVFRSWLLKNHKLTYTAYHKLEAKERKKLYDAYQKRGSNG